MQNFNSLGNVHLHLTSKGKNVQWRNSETARLRDVRFSLKFFNYLKLFLQDWIIPIRSICHGNVHFFHCRAVRTKSVNNSGGYEVIRFEFNIILKRFPLDSFAKYLNTYSKREFLVRRIRGMYKRAVGAVQRLCSRVGIFENVIWKFTPVQF